MPWFSRKIRKRPATDLEQKAIAVRRVLRFQIEEAQKMSGESDLSRFFEKELVLGYVSGFLDHFHDFYEVDDENLRCMMIGGVLGKSVDGKDKKATVHNMIRVGAPLREFVRDRLEKGAKSFLAGEASGKMECAKFLLDQSDPPLTLIEFLVSEARIQQQGLKVDTNDLVKTPEFGSGYYQNLIEILVLETGYFQDQIIESFADLAKDDHWYTDLEFLQVHLCFFAMAVTSYAYHSWADENEAQKKNALEDYSTRILQATWNVFRKSNEPEELELAKLIDLKEIFGEYKTACTSVLHRWAIQEDESAYYEYAVFFLSTVAGLDDRDFADHLEDVAAGLDCVTSEFLERIRGLIS